MVTVTVRLDRRFECVRKGLLICMVIACMHACLYMYDNLAWLPMIMSCFVHDPYILSPRSNWYSMGAK